MDAKTRTYARFRRSEIVRERTRPNGGAQPPRTHEELVKEVEDAIAFAQSGYFKRDAPYVVAPASA